jgi:hypothetical protein
MSFDVLKSLKLFRQSDNLGNTELVSLEENNNMMGNFPFPMGIEWFPLVKSYEFLSFQQCSALMEINCSDLYTL